MGGIGRTSRRCRPGLQAFRREVPVREETSVAALERRSVFPGRVPTRIAIGWMESALMTIQTALLAACWATIWELTLSSRCLFWGATIQLSTDVLRGA